jgi:hypothetical protein
MPIKMPLPRSDELLDCVKRNPALRDGDHTGGANQESVSVVSRERLGSNPTTGLAGNNPRKTIGRSQKKRSEQRPLDDRSLSIAAPASMGNNPRICDFMNRAGPPPARPKDGPSCFPRAGAVSFTLAREARRVANPPHFRT